MAERRARRPGTGEARFAAYLDAIAAVLDNVRRAASARDYCTGLLLPGERKSVEPMAARMGSAVAGRAQERGAHGGADGARPGASQAPVDAPRSRQGRVGRRGAAAGGARAGLAGDRAARAGALLD